MNKLLTTTVLLLLFSAPVLACSPTLEIARPLAERMVGVEYFIGMVKSVSENQVTFTVITPGKPAGNAQFGEDVTLPRGQYGTCSRLSFNVQETWLYDGSDIGFSTSQRLMETDLKDGRDIENVKRNLLARLTAQE